MYWFCHISTWICHRYIHVPYPWTLLLLPHHTIPLGRPSAPAPSIQYRASNLDWQLVLSFKISFLLPTLGFFISSFSSCFRCRVRLFIWRFSCFLRCACLLWTFPLGLLLKCPIGFGLLCFHFHSFLCKFWFLFWFLLWFVGYSAACCSASICWNF